MQLLWDSRPNMHPENWANIPCTKGADSLHTKKLDCYGQSWPCIDVSGREGVFLFWFFLALKERKFLPGGLYINPRCDR